MTPTRAVLLALLLTGWAYAPVRSASYVYEDSNAIEGNPAVNGLEPIQLGRTRWLSAVSHRLVFTAFGAEAGPTHLVNLGLHLTNGWLVYLIASEVITGWPAALAAAIFLLHPLQTESVAYAASRSELLAACFALVALWLSFRADRWWQHLSLWLCVALAVCAKESAAVVVPILVLTRIYHGRALSHWLLAGLLVPVAAIAASVIAFDYRAHSVLPLLPYMATQMAALWRYLLMVPLPFGQTIDHDFELLAMEWRWLAFVLTIGFACLAGFISLSVLDEHGQRARLWDNAEWLQPAAFGVAWALIAIGPRFVMRIPETLNEHQLYLSMAGIAMALAPPLVDALTPLWTHHVVPRLRFTE